MLGVMSLNMFLIFRGKPEVSSCRDGGSIIASYKDIFGNNYSLTLPIKWNPSKEDMKVIGYKAPKLEKLVREKKISKGSGKPYFINSEIEISLSKARALKIAIKIRDAVAVQECYRIALDLVHGIESN